MARHVLAGAILLSIVAGSAAYGFGTVSILGQNREHERITRHALGCVYPGTGAHCFQPKSLDEIAGKGGTYGGVGAPDNITRGLMSSSAAHCDNGDFLATPGYPTTPAGAQATLQSCRNWMNNNLNAAVADARPLVVNGAVDDSQIPTWVSCTYDGTKGRAKCNVLEDFGLTLHASEDFYSHTNWTDLPDPARPVAINNPPGLGNTLKAPWLNLRGSAPFPAGLISGCFEGVPEHFFCNASGGRAKHEFLNKDKGQIDPVIGPSTTPRGMVSNNFSRAVTAAIDDTKDKWEILQERLITHYGAAEGALMICAISHDDPARTCPAIRSRSGVTTRSILLLGMFAFFAMYELFGSSLLKGLRGSKPASGRAS